MLHRAKTHPNISSDGVLRLLSPAERRLHPPQPKAVLAIIRKYNPKIRNLDPKEVTANFLEALRPRLGSASFDKLKELIASTELWVAAEYRPRLGPVAPFLLAALRRAYKKLCIEVGSKALQHEWADEFFQNAARKDDRGVLRLFQYVENRVRQLARRSSGQWYVPGMSLEEVIADAQVDVLEAIQSGAIVKLASPGKAACIRIAIKGKNKAWKRRRFYEVTDAAEVIGVREKLESAAREPEAESLYIAKETELRAKRALEVVEKKGSRIQKGWLAAMRADVQWHGRLNMQRAAGQLARSRAAGSRARDGIERMLRDELGEEGL